jgi:HEAT repeat protein
MAFLRRTAIWLGRWLTSGVRSPAHGPGSPEPDREILLSAADIEVRQIADIRYLAPLLCSANSATAEKAAVRVSGWLAAARPSQLAKLDEAFRHSTFLYQSATRTWRDLSPAALDDARGIRRDILLKLASFHGNGFVRHAAVSGLARIDSGDELPFLLLRANDWVGPVRDSAQSALDRRLRPEYASHLLNSLPLVLRLREATRERHDNFVDRTLTLLVESDGGRALLEGLHSDDTAVRRASFALASFVPSANRSGFVAQAGTSRDPMIRLAAVRAASHLAEWPELRILLKRWLTDRFVPVRREALGRVLESFPEDVEDALAAALFDSNAGVRVPARFHLRARGTSNFTAIYRDGLETHDRRRRGSALLGLGETGTQGDVAAILPHLDDLAPGIQRAALKALAQLDGDRHIDRFLAALASGSPGVSREAREALRTRATLLSADRLRGVGSRASNLHVRQNALFLVNCLNHWEALPDLLLLANSSEAAVANVARTYVDKWLADYNRRFFTHGTPTQLNRLRVRAPGGEKELARRTRAFA